MERAVLVDEAVARAVDLEILRTGGAVDVDVVVAARRGIARFQCIVDVVDVTDSAICGLVAPVIDDVVGEAKISRIPNRINLNTE